MPSRTPPPRQSPPPGSTPPPRAEWFTQPRNGDNGGLRFACTMCGNCCSGPAGYVIVSDEEVAVLAARLKITPDRFLADFTHMTEEGRSLNEKKSPAGLDCIFLDREKIPGKAVCGLYEDRPIQCRTWPFWPSVIKSERTWEQAKRTCPGMDNGKLYPPEKIRIQRDAFDI